MKTYSWWRDFVHNCIVHPILPFIPRKVGDALHERNGHWAYGKDK